MSPYLIRRLIYACVTIIGATFLVAGALRLLPGNAVDVILTTGAVGGPQARAQLEHQLGIDEPFPVAYAHWAANLGRGRLGHSLINGQPIARYIKEGLPVTIELGLLSLAFGTLFGLPVGILSAVYQDSWIDYMLRSLSILLLSVPGFLISVIAIVLASKLWNWNPPLTYIKFTSDPLHNLGQFVFPSVILGFSSAAALMRFTRTAMLDVIRQDYIRTARAKGLSAYATILGHGLRNALIPIISVISVFLAYIIGGTVIFEQIFQLPGLGRFLLSEANTRDYPGVQDIALIFACVVVIVNLVTDFCYTWIDPRIRLE